MQSLDNKSHTTDSAPSQRLENGSRVALQGKQTVIEAIGEKEGKTFQLQQLADNYTAKKGPNTLAPQSKEIIQRQIVGPGGSNSWSTEIAGAVFNEKDRTVVEGVHRLHSIQQIVQVNNYGELRTGILKGRYRDLIDASRQENPKEMKYDQPSGSAPASSQPIVSQGDSASAAVESSAEDDSSVDDAPSSAASATPAARGGKKPKQRGRGKKNAKSTGKSKAAVPVPVRIGDDDWIPVPIENNRVAGLENLDKDDEAGLLAAEPTALDDGELLLRGDTRSPQTLRDGGGFKSHLRSAAIEALEEEGKEITEENITEKEQELIKAGEGHSSALEHMVPKQFGAASSFMSFTRAMEPGVRAISEADGGAAAGGTQGYIYAVVASDSTVLKEDELIQAVIEYNENEGDQEAQTALLHRYPVLNAYVQRENFQTYNQAEFLVANQVNWDDVVAYQEVRNGHPFGPIMMRQTLQRIVASRTKIASMFKSTPDKLEKE